MIKKVVMLMLILSTLVIPTSAASANYNPGEYIAVLRFTIPDWWSDYGYTNYSDLDAGAYYVVNNTDNRVFSTTSTVKPMATDNGFAMITVNESFTITQYDYAVFPLSGSTTNVTPNPTTNLTIANLTIDTNTVDTWHLWGLYNDTEYTLRSSAGLPLETQTGNSTGEVIFTTDLTAGNTYTVTMQPYVVVYALDAETLGSIGTFNTTFNGTPQSTTIGYTLYENVTDGTYTLSTAADGYVTDTRSIEIQDATTVIVSLEKEGTIYYGKHYVKFIVKNILSALRPVPDTIITISGNVSAPDANITANMLQSTTRTVFANGYTTTYTTSALSGSTVVGGNIAVLSGITGNDGAAVFRLYENVQYSMVFTTPTGQVVTKNIYPKDSEYTIIIIDTNVVPDDRIEDDILYGTAKSSINLTTGYVNATFNDTSSTTTLAEFWVNNTNGTNVYYTNTTDSAKSFSAQVPGGNTTYMTRFKITNTVMSDPLEVVRSVKFNDVVRYSLGLDEGWKYQFIAIVLIFFIGLLGSALNADKMAVIVVLAGWFFIFLGWLTAGASVGGEIGAGMMLMLATLLAFGNVVRKGDVG